MSVTIGVCTAQGFLEGDLPLVPVAPVLWGPIVKVEGSGGGEGL